MQLVFNAQQLGDFLFFDRSHRDAGPARHHFFDVFFRDHTGRRVVEIVFLAKLAHVFALFPLFVRVEPRLLELVVRDRVFHAMHDEFDALLNIREIARQGGLAQLHARACLVDQIDRLVRQETIRNVAVRSEHGRFDRFVGVADRMELLVAVLDPEHDLYRVGLVRRRHFHGLEAPFERPVLLDRFAEFGRGRRADALNLAARERGLQNISGIERSLRGTRADQRMQLVDEDDGVLILHQLLHDGLEPLFELAAILGASHDQRKIERQNALVRQERRHVALGDLLRQTLHDRRLADAWLADQHRIVLGAAAQDLHDALELVVAADQRVERIVHRGLGQIARELGEQRAFLRAVRLHLFRLRTLQFFPDGGKPQPALMQDLRRKTFLFAQQSEQQMLGADVLVIQPLCFFRAVREHALAFVAEREIDRSRDLLPNRGVPFNLLSDGIDGRVRPQKPVGQLFVFPQKPEQQDVRSRCTDCQTDSPRTGRRRLRAAPFPYNAQTCGMDAPLAAQPSFNLKILCAAFRLQSAIFADQQIGCNAPPSSLNTRSHRRAN